MGLPVYKWLKRLIRAENSSTVPPLTRPDGSLAATDAEIATELNEHFERVSHGERPWSGRSRQ